MNVKPLQPPLPFWQRNNLQKIAVLHATVGVTARGSISHLRRVRLSYHYIVTRDAKGSAKNAVSENTEHAIYQCVPDTRHAFHAGSTIPELGGLGINKSSIGISLANIQRKTNPEPHHAGQLVALDELLAHRPRSAFKIFYHACRITPWNRVNLLNIEGEQLVVTHGHEFLRSMPREVEKHRQNKNESNIIKFVLFNGLLLRRVE